MRSGSILGLVGYNPRGRKIPRMAIFAIIFQSSHIARASAPPSLLVIGCFSGQLRSPVLSLGDILFLLVGFAFLAFSLQFSLVRLSAVAFASHIRMSFGRLRLPGVLLFFVVFWCRLSPSCRVRVFPAAPDSDCYVKFRAEKKCT